MVFSKKLIILLSNNYSEIYFSKCNRYVYKQDLVDHLSNAVTVVDIISYLLLLVLQFFFNDQYLQNDLVILCG